MSSRTTAAAWRADSAKPPAAAPSASARRRVTERSGICQIVMMVNSCASAAEQYAGIEFHLNVLPLIVMLGLEHGERLTQQQRTLGAFGERRSERRRRAFDQYRFSRHRAVGLELHAQHDIDFRRLGDA